MKANPFAEKPLIVRNEKTPIRIFADMDLYASMICLFWDRTLPRTAGGGWSPRGLLNDGRGCLTTHLSDIGLFLDGSAWSKHDGVLEEQAPKKLFSALPVLYVSANIGTAQNKVNKDMFGPQGPYESPVYKYPMRNDRFFIFYANLKCTAEKPPLFWGLRGTALLAPTLVVASLLRRAVPEDRKSVV